MLSIDISILFKRLQLSN